MKISQSIQSPGTAAAKRSVKVTASRAASAAGTAQPKLKVTETLQGFLVATLDEKTPLTWQRNQAKDGEFRLADTFVATQPNGVTLTLKATRPASGAEQVPENVGHWRATLSAPGKKDRVLDGPALLLPRQVDATTDPASETLPKLFRAVYASSGKQFDEVVPLIDLLTQKLKNGAIVASHSFIRPSLANPFAGGATVLQVGDGAQRVELTKFGDRKQITVRDGAKTHKLGRASLENTALFQALDALVAEATFQRTRKAGKGLAAF